MYIYIYIYTSTDHAAAVVDGVMVVFGGTHTIVEQDGQYKADTTSHVWTLALDCLPAQGIINVYKSYLCVYIYIYVYVCSIAFLAKVL